MNYKIFSNTVLGFSDFFRKQSHSIWTRLDVLNEQVFLPMGSPRDNACIRPDCVFENMPIFDLGTSIYLLECAFFDLLNNLSYTQTRVSIILSLKKLLLCRIPKLENACIEKLQQFHSLNTVDRSHLHVLLSSCVNTVLESYQPDINQIIGEKNITTALEKFKTQCTFSTSTDPTWKQIKDNLIDAHEKSGFDGMRLWVIQQRLDYYLSKSTDNDIIFLNIMEIIIKNVEDDEMTSESSLPFIQLLIVQSTVRSAETTVFCPPPNAITFGISYLHLI